MADVPSIRGFGFLNSWAEIHQLLDHQVITREELFLRLEMASLDLVDGEVRPDAWYPIDAAEPLVAIAAEFRASVDLRDLLETGRRGFARALNHPGLRASIDGDSSSEFRVDAAMTRLGSSLFSFGEWKSKSGGLAAAELEMRGARRVSEPMSWVAAGFVAAAIQHWGGRDAFVEPTRVAPDCIVWTTS